MLPRTFHALCLLLAAFVAHLVGSVSASEKQRLFSSAFAIPGTNASYDYVVVGGGTAGLAIASRLAEFASVAVIEAGGWYQQDNGNQSVVPYYGLVAPILAQTESYPRQPLVDWDLVSTTQVSAGSRKIHYAQGKTLGGSSALNTMAYLRATFGTYQRWADMVDDQNYTFENLLPFFKKSTHFTPPNLEKRDTPDAIPVYDSSVFDNRKGGKLQVSYGNWVDPTINGLSKALRAADLPVSPTGFSSGFLSGYGAWVSSTISPEHAERSTSQSSYLKQAIEKTGLVIYTHSQATKVLFDSSPRATAVKVSTQGLEYVISANEEVIVSAGVFHSPQLLMVSGIGPEATLNTNNIPVISKLPGVGQNLIDPVFFNVLYGVTTISSGGVVADLTQSSTILSQYLNNASGPYSSAGGYFAFEKLPPDLRQSLSNSTLLALAAYPEDWPEIQHVVSGFPGGINFTIGSVSPTLILPSSRGNVTISSPSISDPPVINLGWLSTPEDAEFAVAALKRARQIWNTTAALSIRVGDEISPGPAVLSDADILDYIRNSAQTTWHASSTCAMGKPGDVNAVVDSRARVFGVEGLRVVDISIFPFGIPSNPQATVYALAEKIADDIKNGR